MRLPEPFTFLLDRCLGTKAVKVGDALALALPGMRKAMRRFQVPVMGRVNAAGELVVLYAEGKKLKPPKHIKVPRLGRL